LDLDQAAAPPPLIPVYVAARNIGRAAIFFSGARSSAKGAFRHGQMMLKLLIQPHF
jgi:hypothetical protein